MSGDFNIVQFSKPFIDGLKDTFATMVQTEIKTHSPQIKKDPNAIGDISALIGMNGLLEKDGKTVEVKGLIALSWKEDVYVKMASRMLMEEYSEYNEEISDTGAEIVNIVMGNAKAKLASEGFKIEMASPSTVKGRELEIKYPPKATIIEITCSADIGEFSLEICYQEN